MRCSLCGFEVKAMVRFCPGCGQELIGPSTEPVQTHPPIWSHDDEQERANYGLAPDYHGPYAYTPKGSGSPKSGLSMDRVAVITKISVVFLIFILGGLFLYYWTVPDIPSGGEGQISVNIASTQMESRIIDGDQYWDATFFVNKLRPKDQTISWEEIKVSVKDQAGRTLFKNLKVFRDNPSNYDNALDGRLDVETWFIKMVENPNNYKIEAGDTLKITGLTSDYMRAKIVIKFNGDQISSLTLPSDFTNS